VRARSQFPDRDQNYLGKGEVRVGGGDDIKEGKAILSSSGLTDFLRGVFHGR